MLVVFGDRESFRLSEHRRLDEALLEQLERSLDAAVRMHEEQPFVAQSTLFGLRHLYIWRNIFFLILDLDALAHEQDHGVVVHHHVAPVW